MQLPLILGKERIYLTLGRPGTKRTCCAQGRGGENKGPQGRLDVAAGVAEGGRGRGRAWPQARLNGSAGAVDCAEHDSALLLDPSRDQLPSSLIQSQTQT